MISIDKVSIRFGGFELFKEISFLVNPRDRIGLVGKNGAGKSTILKLLAGIQQPDGGQVVVPAGIELGYLPQQMVHQDRYTLIEEVKQAFQEIIKLQAEIDYLNNQLVNRTDYESEEYLSLINKLTYTNERLEVLGQGTMEAQIEQTLLGLGFSPSDFEKPTKSFSGGWRTRIELAKVLLKQPGVLLLDEHTKHLDMESIQWLENIHVDFPGAVLCISHDKAFLDNITRRTIELSLGKIHDYNVGYSKFVQLRQERREQQMAAYRNQQKMIEETEQFIDRFRSKATKAVQVQSRIKQLEKIQRVEVEEEDVNTISLKFPPAPRSGDIVVDIKNVTKKYGDKLVLDNIDLIIERGEKVSFVGKNGEGKTTLSRIIMDELEYEGKVKIGHNVKVGYFAQNQDELMDGDKSVLQVIDEVAVGDARTKIRDILGSFLFRGEDVEKKVKVLSGGERSRLVLAKLLLEPYNLLVMDEPTNHLDMYSKDILKQALLNYKGTLVLVSHDREFLDGLVEKVYEFTQHKIREHIGGIYDFLQKKKISSLVELERKNEIKYKEFDKTSEQKQDYLRRKEIEKEIRKIAKKLDQSEVKIGKLEASLQSMNDKISSCEVEDDDFVFFENYNEIKKELDAEMKKWEKLVEELEILKNEKNE